MAIVYVDPPDADTAKLVQVDSTADSLMKAITEIDDWGVPHGLIRTNDFYLRRVLIDGQMRYRGICYRPSPEETAAADADFRRMVERAERGPTLPPNWRDLR